MRTLTVVAALWLGLAGSLGCSDRPDGPAAPVVAAPTVETPGMQPPQAPAQPQPVPADTPTTSPAAAAPAPRAVEISDAGHVRLGPPEAGDWRDRYPNDVPDDFEHYVDGDPVRAEGDVRVIAFQPVGPFDAESRRALNRAAEFTTIWFDLPTRTLADVALTDEEGQWRDRAAPDGTRGERWRQWRTGWFLNMLLPDLRPKDAVVILGVTMGDLYPGRTWNYVFGEADLRRRVGVYSLARYFPEFWNQEKDEAALRMALLRTLKVVVHETGHMFGLEHCVTWQCAMNGSNSLAETDSQPLRLCPDCMKKLAWNRGFDIAARHEKIAKFLETNGLKDEAAWYRTHAPLK